jgi:excisionase family DNA binding protein
MEVVQLYPTATVPCYNPTVVFARPGGDVLKTGEPAFLRVREAAAILGISRSAAYELANAWLATDGQTGLPAVRMGRCILIPRAAMDRLAAVGGEDRHQIGLAG